MKPLHLLITDDDLDKRTVLARAVTREFPHASVFECHSGQEALEYCAGNRVDAVITNHNMYPVNGIELVTTLRRCGSSVPIIMISGHPDVRAEAEAAGVDLFLEWNEPSGIGKPIAEFLKRRGLRDRVER
jgi:CheY-like chemotaxis protein